MTTAVAPVSPSNPYAALNGTATGTVTTANDAASADRFLKLLVTQMQNQDPLNPMDNAQVTSQMAQINTVSGIEKLNTTVQGLNAQFNQMQALTGASLVGRYVTLKGDQLDASSGTAVGGLELAGTADTVKVEVLSTAGRLVDTLELGALDAGQHGFQWTPPADAAATDYRFRITAKAGAAAVTSTPLMLDRVVAVSSKGSTLNLQTERSGTVAYADVKAVN